MSAEPAEPRRPPARGARNVLLLLGGSFASAFAVIALFTNKATSALLLILAAFVLLFSYAMWIVGTDMIAPERWTPQTRRARLAVVALVALTYAACSWMGYSQRATLRLTAYELQPLLMVLLLILPKPASRKSRGPARAAGNP